MHHISRYRPSGLLARTTIALIALLAGPSPCLFGQAAAINGTIEGTVTDPAGAPLPNAKVSIENTGTGFRQEADTNGRGFYRFQVLPLGTYNVTVNATGFSAQKRSGLVLTAGATATVNVEAQLQNVTTEVVVTAAAAVTEPSRTDLGSTLTSNSIQNLPLVSRNPYNFILVQPNVTGRPNTEFGVPRKINANGFNGRINYQIDGMNNTQSDRAGIRLIPISNTFVQEIQQVNNGFAPEFGNTVGTVFNTITRSGTNDLHGEAAYIFRRTPFSARPALLAYTQPTPDLNVDSFLGSAGGRIKRDKVFFYASYEKVKRDLPQAVTASPSAIQQLGLPANYANAIPFTQDVHFFVGKLDFQFTSNERLTIRYNGHRNDSPYNSNAFGLGVLSRTYNFIDRSHVVAAQLVSVFGPNAINEVRLQAPYRLQRQETLSGVSGTGPAIAIPNVILFGGSTAVGFRYKEIAPELAENFSYNLSTHALKVGGSIRAIRDTQVQATSATYTFPTIQAYLNAASGVDPKGYTTFAQTLGEPALRYNHNFFSLFAQDSWKYRPNVTFTYGVRYDLYKPPDAVANSPYEGSRQFTLDKNNFAPRLGVAVALGKNQKTVIRASGGFFYDPPQTDVYRRALLNNGSPNFLNVSTANNTAFAPSFPAVFTGFPSGFSVPLQTVEPVSRDFRTLYSVNGNFSITQQLAADTALTATYLYTKGSRLPVYRNINLIPSGNSLADGRPIFGTAKVDPRFANILMAESVGNSIYNGLTVSLNKRFRATLEGFASYTWAHSIDDAPEQNNIDSGSFFLSDVTNRRRDRGNSLTDRRHSLSASGVWSTNFTAQNNALAYLVNHNRLSFTLVAYSGDVFNIGSNRQLNGDPTSTSGFQRPLFIGRNTYRGPKTVQLDLRYGRVFPIRERSQFEFFAEFTNLLNKTNVTGVSSNATVDTLGNITAAPTFAWTSALDSRLMQLGIKYVF